MHTAAAFLTRQLPFRPPSLDQIRAERRSFVDTVAGLTEAEFESGETLCAGWTPRDVLAHLIGTARTGTYLRAPWRLHQINADFVAEGRRTSRAELIAAGRTWADVPEVLDRVIAPVLLGDVAVHHQDVLRAAGRTRELPRHVEGAIFFEGVVLSLQRRRPTLLRYRVEPTNGVGLGLGRGTPVRGTAEALGMWLAGRTVPDVEVAK